MNLAEQMRATSTTVTNKDKLDIIFNELVLPQIERRAKDKQFEVSFSSFGLPSREDARVKQIFPEVRSLQELVGGEMKPYLVDLGFKVIVCSPAYYTYIRW